MKRHILTLLLLTTMLQACKDRSKQNHRSNPGTGNTATIDRTQSRNLAYENEQECLIMKRQLCAKLALYDIEKVTTDYELRMWLFPSNWDPSILYVLKRNDSIWTLFHYQFYRIRSTDQMHYYDNPVIDSVVMESVKPQKTNWKTYIDKLRLDSLWNLQTESEIKGKTFAVLDGHEYLLEINDKGKYKYFLYTTPSYFQDKDINHKKFMEFKKHLVDPIIFNGMHNP